MLVYCLSSVVSCVVRPSCYPCSNDAGRQTPERALLVTIESSLDEHRFQPNRRFQPTQTICPTDLSTVVDGLCKLSFLKLFQSFTSLPGHSLHVLFKSRLTTQCKSREQGIVSAKARRHEYPMLDRFSARITLYLLTKLGNFDQINEPQCQT